MPFAAILNELLEQSGGQGALFLDDNGETVDVAGDELPETEMQLLGAYMGIYLRQFQRAVSRESLGTIDILHVEHEGLHLYGVPLVDGYAVVLAQRPPAHTGVTRRLMERAARRLVTEVFGVE